jgi:hypothetical protein
MSAMHAQAIHGDLDPMFEELLETLESMLELSAQPDREDRLGELLASFRRATEMVEAAKAQRG